MFVDYKAFEVLKVHLELEPIAPNDVVRIQSEIASHTSPDWWPKNCLASQFFSGQGVISGDAGDLYQRSP